jgi:hypothetical protein
MRGEEARRFPLIREHPEHTPHANESRAGSTEVETGRDHTKRSLPDDDERDDGATVESQVERTARAVHLWTSGIGRTYGA